MILQLILRPNIPQLSQLIDRCSLFIQMITTNSAPESKHIVGALRGLDALLISFPCDFDGDGAANRCQDIFRYTQASFQPQTHINRFEVPVGKFLGEISRKVGGVEYLAIQCYPPDSYPRYYCI